VKVSGDGRKVTSLLAVAEDPQAQPGGEGVHDGDADAVQAAGDLVGVLVELTARMELGHDDLGRRDALARMDVRRDAAAVVGDRDGAVGVERDGHLRRMARQRLVDGVVDHLVDHVMQAGAVIRVADIHARALAHRIQALEDLDRVRAVGVGGEVHCWLSHSNILGEARRRRGARNRRSRIAGGFDSS
jgi:hypothetical protein